MGKWVAGIVLLVGCAPRYVQPTVASLPIDQSLEGQTPITIEVDAIAPDLVVGEHLGGLAKVHQYDYKVKDLGGIVRQRLIDAARRFGFAPRAPPAAVALRATFGGFKVTTRDFFAGDDASVDIQGEIKLSDPQGKQLYAAPLRVESEPGDGDEPNVLFEQLDVGLTAWVRELAAALAAQPELARSLERRAPAPQATVAGALVEPSTLLMMGIKRVGAVQEHVPTLLTRLLLAGLQEVRGLKGMGVDDIEMMLTVERKKDALGCDTTSCMAEIGGALGARFVVAGELGLLGKSYTLTLSVLDSKSSSVCARLSRVLPQDDEALGAMLPGVVDELVTKLNQSLQPSS